MNDADTILQLLEEDQLDEAKNEINKFREEPLLLDSVLRQCVSKLCSRFSAISGGINDSNATLDVLYTLRTVRGEKAVLQCLEVDVSLMPKILELLDMDTEIPWKSQYVLLLWIAAIILIPFDLESVVPDMFIRITELARSNLSKSGIQRDASAVLMSRILTRQISQQDELLSTFIKDYNASTMFEKIGKLKTLANALDRINFVPESMRYLIEEYNTQFKSSKSSELETKLYLKILCRAAVRDWSYTDMALDAFESLLYSNSSVLRYSAAKYIARVEATASDADMEQSCLRYLEILSENIENMENDPNYWNGMLTLLAELLRVIRKPIENFSRALCRVLIKGLHFTQERVSYSIGQNVRDAACYVCWSFFRSYIDLTDVYEELCDSLLALSLLDREINVRRAAAAALQEGLGRYNVYDYKKKFKIIENVNFHSVSLATNCYSKIAPLFTDIRDFLNYVLIHGIQSSDPEMQRLCAQNLPNFKDISYHTAVDFLLKNVKASNFENRGILLALASLYVHSDRNDYRISEIKEIMISASDFTSELELEAALRLCVVDVSFAPSLLERSNADSPEIIAAAVDLMAFIQQNPIVLDQVIKICSMKVNENKLCISCLTALSFDTSIFRESVMSSDPEVRSIAVKRLTQNDTDLLFSSLNDYTIDIRGDVGSLVRIAAIKRVEELKLLNPEILKSLWRLSSESNHQIRGIASSALLSLQQLKSDINTGNCYEYFVSLISVCPQEIRPIMLEGLVDSIGGNGSETTTSSSFAAFTNALQNGADWMLPELFKLDRSTIKRLGSVLRTIRLLILSGLVKQAQVIFAISYNTTLKHNIPESLFADAIDILQMYSPEPKAVKALMRILKTNRNGRLRKRAADALFESGLEDEILESEDWTRNDCYQKGNLIKL